ncbi:hypothetical protein K505DRAFT_292599 [Melanomma pulvis-pyrius CBS 109.77]|uniref:Capsule polysaccharide biosynthesis protein n=1 Tax=Melanomma pulvis-pyrius CBS 109.77 TaxID=1314802 RepID=A0A6A6XVZ0_9PLEO|nr:hypothetical protein K505DRAFT_292599 [Melanomma pulvis-pyrius CBS 109.77]
MDYPAIPNTVPTSSSLVKIPSASDPLPKALLSPSPPTSTSKSIFAFWNNGLTNLPPYLLRNVLAWHTRFSPLGWTIYVLDNVPSSPLNVANYIDTAPTVVPVAFTSGTLDGGYAAQHTSDLIRYPLLLKYGGVYLDVGILQFGDLNWMWTEHIANPDSPYDFAGFTMGDAPELNIVNFALMCGRANPLVARAHAILLKLWEGKTNTEGMHDHPLVRHVPLMRVPQEGKMVINDQSMTDYAIQIQCMGSAQRWVDEEDEWDGPKYVREKAWLLSMMDGAFLFEQITGWNSAREFQLFGLQLPKTGEKESEDQKAARELVEKVVGQSWCLKLGHGFSAKLFGADTLGMLWRKSLGSDCGVGTYAGWLRWAEVNCTHERKIEPMKIPAYEPTMRGRLVI